MHKRSEIAYGVCWGLVRFLGFLLACAILIPLCLALGMALKNWISGY